MKSTLFLSFLLISLTWTSCQRGTNPGKSDSTDKHQDASVKNTAIPDSVKLPYAIAKHYVANYAKHAGFIDAAAADSAGIKPSKPDTRAIWFSKERLKQMLAELEDEGGDGIRFYLMTYDNHYSPGKHHHGPPPPPRDYWGYNSLIMVSTKDSTASGRFYHRDYFTASDVPSAENKGKNPGFIVGIVPENRGELCPPPAECGITGALLLSK